MNDKIGKFEPVLTIGTVAEKLDVSVHTIRLYEKEGLILPFKTSTGRRMFSLHDLEKLVCIRKMITEHSLNLQGIKRLMALIPCWEYRGGLDHDCINCDAYYKSEGPCWSIKEVGPKCQKQDCRACPVYQMNVHCEQLKEIIYNHQPYPDKHIKSHKPDKTKIKDQ